MRDKIDQLESQTNLGGAMIAPVGLFDAAAVQPSPEQAQKMAKKIRSKEVELKSVKSELLDKKNALQKAELK